MERDELESAAANYFYLRGLFCVPVGMLMVLAGLGNLEWGPFRHTWVFVVAVIAAAAGYLVIARYYTLRYGRVTLTTKTWVKAGAAVAGGVVLVVAGERIDWLADVPVSATACAFALVMAGSYAVTTGVRIHHAIIWGGILLAGLLPVWGEAGPDVKTNIGLVLVGGATIITGVFDHGALKRGLGRFDVRTGNGDAGA